MLLKRLPALVKTTSPPPRTFDGVRTLVTSCQDIHYYRLERLDACRHLSGRRPLPLKTFGWCDERLQPQNQRETRLGNHARYSDQASGRGVSGSLL